MNWTNHLEQNGKLYNYIMTGTNAEKQTAIEHIKQISQFVDRFNSLDADVQKAIEQMITDNKVITPTIKRPTVSKQKTVNLSKKLQSFKTNTCAVVAASDYALLNTEGWLIKSDFDCEYGINVSYKPKRNILIPLDIIKTFGTNIRGVEYDYATHKGSIDYSGGTVEFTSTDADTFPDSSTLEEPKTFEFTNEMIDLANKFVSFASSDDLRPVMKGVFIGPDGVACTDAHKLGWIDKKLNTPIDLIVDKKYVPLLLSGNAQTDGKYLKIENENEYIIVRLIDGIYPKYHAVIPKDNPIHITMKDNAVKEMLENIKKLIPIANKTTSLIEFDFENKKMRATDIDFGKSLELNMPEFTAKIKQPKPVKNTDGELVPQPEITLFNIGVNGKFFQDVLKVIGSGNLNLELSAPNRAIICNNEVLLMPVMIKN